MDQLTSVAGGEGRQAGISGSGVGIWESQGYLRDPSAHQNLFMPWNQQAIYAAAGRKRRRRVKLLPFHRGR